MSWVAPPPPPPATKLGVYRVFSSRAGVHASPLCLGATSIGDKWESFMGSVNKGSSFKLMDAYFDKGGNLIDTASNYQGETSEEFIGEWAEKRRIRDELFIDTEYRTMYKKADPKIVQKVDFTGNNAKNMHLSVNVSLKKLRTDYIDLFYIHWWDYDTSIEEFMDGLHNLVIQGKVLYLGISDTPAWIVAQANQSFERDIIPMARSFGMALAPGGVLAGGKLRTGITSVAIAYVMQKTTHVFPIIGGRKVEQLEQNLEALDIAPTSQQIFVQVGWNSLEV
ncbi:putative aryl-alcohol dehydrogenase aad14 [Marasmius crinis-equi]|uniref:Aryl-alcohol dehydrogenase aad14 n=1 Tax=Marasmius crinis-equi TaxID=585013 RepID=A0ABR3FVP8_9AGAR